MAIDYDALRNFKITDLRHAYTEKDVMLYALGLGLGADPLDKVQLRFVYEDGLQVLPTYGGVMGYPGFWLKDHPELGITWQRLLNGEQGIEIHRPFPTNGVVLGTMRVDEVVDKGEGKGALVYTTRDVTDAASGELLCTVTNTVFCRADGGFGGPPVAARPVTPLPDRPADLSVDTPTMPQAALIYRLSGDYNPLHADPEVAKQGGFSRPILHGAASWALAGWALMQSLCAGEPARFRKFAVRFTSPVYPGETLHTEIWKTGPGKASFRVTVPARSTTVLDNGTFEYLGD